MNFFLLNYNHYTTPRRNRHGFTLIELLVVMAIIALLASMLLPTLSKARGMARRAVCISNLKQIGLVLMMYADDHNDTTPNFINTVYWYPGACLDYICRSTAPNGLGLLYSEGYIDNERVLYCPGKDAQSPSLRGHYDNPDNGWANWLSDTTLGGYWYRGGDGANWSGKRLTKAAKECRVAVVDSWAFGEDSGENHRGGFNMLYYDGHVKWYSDSGLSLLHQWTEGTSGTNCEGFFEVVDGKDVWEGQ